jgi:hypothetical protein
MNRSSTFGLGAAIAMLLLTAACAPMGLKELYVPRAGGAGYGYAEQSLGDRRFQIVYDAPLQTAYSVGPQQKAQELGRSFDLALLRAADIALANGMPAFRVVDRVNDVDVRAYPSYRDPFWYPGWRRPYYGYPWAYDPFYDNSYQVLSTRVNLTIELLPAVEDGAYDARNVQATIRARYAVPAA